LPRNLIEPGLFDAAQDDTGLVTEPFCGLAQFIVEMRNTLAEKVLQLYPFQVVPDSLTWSNSGA
jgi:hypothetical protein